ncbi:MAG: DUF2218 domain-containing protein [Pseudomonadota bacterium]
MPVRVARIETEHASRYLQQLCKHFGHKVPVEFTAEKGHVTLPFGTCAMTADAHVLQLTVDGKSQDLQRLEQFVGQHLARFAFRENPTITWTSQTEGGSA